MRCDWDLSPAQESLLTSVVFLGTMVGSYLWGALSDCKGRRRGFAATAACIFIFGVASALAPNYAVRSPLGSQGSPRLASSRFTVLRDLASINSM